MLVSEESALVSKFAEVTSQSKCVDKLLTLARVIVGCQCDMSRDSSLSNSLNNISGSSNCRAEEETSTPLLLSGAFPHCFTM